MLEDFFIFLSQIQRSAFLGCPKKLTIADMKSSSEAKEVPVKSFFNVLEEVKARALNQACPGWMLK